LHGLPNGLLVLAETQVLMMPEKPMSLPPMPTVTRAASAVTAAICAGTAMPSSPEPGFRMSDVVAPPQLTSLKDDELSAARTREG
jgi:hypothetical protein